jgi:hypothetical protein
VCKVTIYLKKAMIQKKRRASACPTRSSFRTPEKCPPGALLRDFCHWSAQKYTHQGQVSGVFAPGALESKKVCFVKCCLLSV